MFKSYFAFLTFIPLSLLSTVLLAEESTESWMPAATEYDWVQLTSGEWLKGEMKAMYSETLEFDSDKLDLLSIDWDDVQYLKSYRPSQINLENQDEPVSGKLQVSGDDVQVTDGDETRLFDRIELISFSPSGNRERDLWALKLTFSLNVRSGNTHQVDYTAQIAAKRRTAKSRFSLDYIGNISNTDTTTGSLEETINNHRLTAGLDIYATRYFFYTPVFGEYFRDPFQNIDARITAGVGVGYTFYDTAQLEWRVTGGPAIISTRYVSVLAGEEDRVDAAALALGTDVDVEIGPKTDFIFKYNIQASKPEAGGYTHHMIATIENELTGHLDLNVSFIWDRISQPTEDNQGNRPDPDDYRLLMGVSYTY